MALSKERSRLINKWVNEANIKSTSVRENFIAMLSCLSDSELRRPFIIRDRKNKLSYEQLSVKYGIPKQTIYSIINRLQNADTLENEDIND